MYKSLTNYALVVFFAGTATVTLPMGFNIRFDGEHVKCTVNGQRMDISQHAIADPVLSGGSAYLASCCCKGEPEGTQLAAILLCGTVGSLLADFLWGKATWKRFWERTVPVAGALLGAACFGMTRTYIPNSITLGGHLGSALVSGVYGDIDQTKVHVGKAVGEQVGMFLTRHEKEIGGALGVNAGAGLASKKGARDRYFKRAVFHATSWGMTHRCTGSPDFGDAWGSIWRSRMADVGADCMLQAESMLLKN